MRSFSSKLTVILLTRGVARFVAPVAICWGIYDWTYVHPLYALGYGLLTFNYVLVYIFIWVAPAHINGLFRVRAWQTFVVLGSMILLPILYYRKLGAVPWGFLGISFLFILALIAGTVVIIYLNQRLPLGPAFARQRPYQFPSLGQFSKPANP